MNDSSVILFSSNANKAFSEFHDVVAFPWNVQELTSILTECVSSLLAWSGVVPPRGQPVWPAGLDLFGRHITFGLTDELAPMVCGCAACCAC